MAQKKKTVKKAARSAAKKKARCARPASAKSRKACRAPAGKKVKSKAKKAAPKKAKATQKKAKAAPKKAKASPKKAKAAPKKAKAAGAARKAPAERSFPGPLPNPPAALNRPLNRKLSEREKKFVEIKQVLIGQKEALLSEAETAINSLPEQTVFPDLGDQATAESDRNFMLRLRGREQRLLNKIEEAMERIDNGVFGVCDSCGEEISLERLRARPVATLCIDCKEEQEEEEKLQAS